MRSSLFASVSISQPGRASLFRSRRNIHDIDFAVSLRRKTLLYSIEDELSDSVRVYPGMAGLHIGASLKRKLSATELAYSALDAGVRIMSFSKRGFALGYGAIEHTDIEQGIGILRKVVSGE